MTDNSIGPHRWTLEGRRALVTGGTKGIGAAVARELLLLGARVTIVARSESDIGARLAEWRDGGNKRVDGFVADISDDRGRAEAITRAAEAMDGGIDILVNNVGTNIRKPSLTYTPDEFEKVFATNLTSVWEMCRAIHPHLKASGNGSIVNIGSVAGSVAVGSGAPYAMTKAAVDQLTRYLAVEWARDNIRVNAVNPWYTRTPLASRVLDDPEFETQVLSRTPADRIADPEDISGAVAFLCLPAARHITGQTLAIDGGFLAYGLPFAAFVPPG